jgi:hypothetical protein
MVSPLARFLWLFVLGFLLINLGIGYWKARALVAAGRLTNEERREFTRSAVLASSIYCFLLTGIQIASHLRDPRCLIQFPPRTSYGVATWVVMVGGLILLLKWLWQGGGDEILARMAPVFTRGSITERTFAPRPVRLVVTTIVVVAACAYLVMQLMVPDLQPRGLCVPAA